MKQKIAITSIFIFSAILSGIFFAEPAVALTISPVRLEVSANAGQTVSFPVKVYNNQRESKTFYMDFQNYEAKDDESGRPTFTIKRDRLASWMEAPEQVLLGPGERHDVTVKIQVPLDADPGGYFAAIFFRTSPPIATEQGAVALGGEVGTLVLLRINGDFSEGAEILEFGPISQSPFFTSPPVDFYYRFQNTGEDWAKPLGDMTVKNSIGRITGVVQGNPDGANVLPQSVRRFEVSWLGLKGKIQDPAATRPEALSPGFWNNVKYQWDHFAIGRYTANLALVYGANTRHTALASTSFWIIPWQLLVVAIPAIILLLVLLRFAMKRYNRWIINKSRKSK